MDSETPEQKDDSGTSSCQKGDVVLTLERCTVFPLFWQSQNDYEPLPKYSAAQHNPLAFVLQDPKNCPAHHGLTQVQKLLLEQAKNANAKAMDLWPLYTAVTAMNLILQPDFGMDQIMNPSLATNCSDDNSDNEENDEELSCEAWTWIQDQIPWQDWQKVVAHVQQRLCLVTAPHPLETYAIQTVPLLTQNEVQSVVDIMGLQSQFSSASSSTTIKSTSTMALRLSQILRDSYPPRQYAVLFHENNSSVEQEANHNKKATIPGIAATQKTNFHEKFRHSCLATVGMEIKPTTISSSSSPSPQLQVDFVALYDDFEAEEGIEVCTLPLDGGELEHQAWKRCHREKNSFSDACILCQNKNKHNNTCSSTHLQEDWKANVRLGHYFFQQERYHDAENSYRAALASNPELDDIRHALGALQLAQGKFLEAQLAWEEAASQMISLGRSPERHDGIHLQLKKTEAYHYLENSSPAKKPGDPKHQYTSYFNNQCFVTPMIEPSTCQKLIQIATSSGKWTTGRHYAVPTNDIPVHEVPEMLDWFYPFMENEIQPLLKEQFDVTVASTLVYAPQTSKRNQQIQQEQRFYVHDAFFVRYQGGGETNHLPCHLDECTHSFVVCLNDDFEGGGTYFHDHDTVLSPKVGEVVTFKGDSLRHGGDAVTSGTRYIIAVFLYLDRCYQPGDDTIQQDNDNHDRTGASLQQNNGFKSNQSGSDGSSSKHQLPSLFHEAKKSKTGFSFGFQGLGGDS